MPTVQVISSSEKDKNILQGAFADLGAEVIFSLDLNDALAIFERVRPRAVFIADGEDPPSEIKIREILRIAPFMPVVVMLKRRDAARAVALMKLGAFDCAQAPWTPEELRPLLKKALKLSGTALAVAPPPPDAARKAVLAAGALAAGLFIFALGYGLSQYRKAEAARPPDEVELPYSHPAGVAFADGEVLVADWYTQSLYRHSGTDYKINGVTSFPDLTPVGLGHSADNLWLATADGVIERRSRDRRLTRTAAAKHGMSSLTGVCFDGLYVWTADGKKGVFQKRMNNDDMRVLGEYPYRGELAAFTCDRDFLWAADSKSGEIIKFPLDNPEKSAAAMPVAELSDRTFRATALGTDGSHVWLTGERGGKGLLIKKNARF